MGYASFERGLLGLGIGSGLTDPPATLERLLYHIRVERFGQSSQFYEKFDCPPPIVFQKMNTSSGIIDPNLKIFDRLKPSVPGIKPMGKQS
jgi:hypothetical protein